MKARELRELTNEELDERLRDKRKALIAFRVESATGVVDNVRAPREARRDIARIKTIKRERASAAASGGTEQ